MDDRRKFREEMCAEGKLNILNTKIKNKQSKVLLN
jgi:hypothetical protein